MFGSTILDVAIGIVFIFLLTSLVASAVREGLEAWLNTRASHLEAGLREILKDPDGTALVQHLYNHPLIYALFSGEHAPSVNLRKSSLLFKPGRNLPSYIPSSNFALALMDMAARGPQVDPAPDATGPITVDGIRANVGSIENPAVQRVLLIALERADGDIAKTQAFLEAWYNSAMDRVSGWYKSNTQAILLTLGLLMAVVFNVNTLKVAGTLYNDKAARDMVVASAQKTTSQSQLSYATASGNLASLDSLVGWPQGWRIGWQKFEGWHWTWDLAGWLITAFAVSIGAPFWFDMLNRLIVIRSTVKPHQKSPEEQSADNENAAPPVDANAAPAQASLMVPPPTQPAQAQATVPPQDGPDIGRYLEVTTDEMLPASAGGVR